MAFSISSIIPAKYLRRRVLLDDSSAPTTPGIYVPYVAIHQESGTSVATAPAAGAEIIATGLITNPSAAITRPSDTTAYTSGDLLANSTTAGSVTFPAITIARVPGGTAMLRRCRLRKTGTGTTNANFRVHLFTALPTTTGGDNAPLSLSGSANYLGAFEVSADRSFSDGAAGSGAPITGSEISVDLSSGTDIYMAVEVRGAYTPASAEALTFIFENFPN